MKMHLADASPVEHERDGRQCLLSGRETARLSERDQRSVVQPALGRLIGRRRQFDVQRAQQAGLTDFRGDVRRKLYISVEAHRDERMPAL